MAKGLTAESVKHAKPGTYRREIPDGFLPGLYLLVQPSGAKSWAVRYRFEGKPSKYTLGRYPALSLAHARERAQETMRKVAEGKNPAAEKIRAKLETSSPKRKLRSKIVEFEAVVTDFIETYAKKKTRDWKNTESLLRRHFVSRWKGLSVRDIRKRDVIDVLDELEDSGLRRGVDHAFSALRKLFNWLVENQRLESSPCAGLKARFKYVGRERFLTNEEIYLYWMAADSLGYPFGPLFKLLLLLGQRLFETTGWRWDEFEEDGSWTLPVERAKNKNSHNLILPQQVREIIGALPRVSYTIDMEGIPTSVKSNLLFTTTGITPVSGFSKAKISLDERMLEIAQERARKAGKDPDEVTLKHFTLHDIRRTLATGMAKLGIPPHVCEAVLNHISGEVSGVAAVYNRWEYSIEKEEALQAWADKVDSIVATFSSDNVVPLALEA